jgi:hypothetical protein
MDTEDIFNQPSPTHDGVTQSPAYIFESPPAPEKPKEITPEKYEKNLREVVEKSKTMPSPDEGIGKFPGFEVPTSRLGIWVFNDVGTNETNLQHLPEYVEAIKKLSEEGGEE